ncbi:phosphotransferase family protein [Cronobacter sakazakii]|uniref:phosphotransferase family protein n=1 Tax=Cronobacter sakazakii TaxID=28141 RepID=UPI000CFC3680|nr:phosphotransferase [Cronobacter sakazakii]ELY4870314.1 phosphotransferase [Cronobacter sakazakii]ELY6266802.1 phosphotransferase [Cronobacter sakazakii]
MLQEKRMSADDLSQMGGACVTLTADKTGRAVIEKRPVGAVEYAFYQDVAHELTDAGILTPTLFAADAEQRKLTLEYIPHAIDQDDVADDRILAILARLHGYPAHPGWHYHPHGWSCAALENALSLLALPVQAARQLRTFHRHSAVLFDKPGLISGDSNAGNWGRRENGEPVLFDWERFGRGSPAMDLAPLIKGMGTAQAFVQMAGRYCRFSSHYPVSELAREIAIAKAWIVTEVVILLHERQKASLPLYLNWYRENLPDWLNQSVRLL